MKGNPTGCTAGIDVNGRHLVQLTVQLDLTDGRVVFTRRISTGHAICGKTVHHAFIDEDTDKVLLVCGLTENPKFRGACRLFHNHGNLHRRTCRRSSRRKGDA